MLRTAPSADQRVEDNAFHLRWIGFSEDDGKEIAEGANIGGKLELAYPKR
jgi:hypothetical protein